LSRFKFAQNVMAAECGLRARRMTLLGNCQCRISLIQFWHHALAAVKLIKF